MKDQGSDENIIRQLQSEEEQVRDKALAYLYRVSQPVVKNFILKNKGNEQDVDDIFHDGLIALYHLVRQNKLDKNTRVEAYLFTICKNMWKKRLIKSPKRVELNERFHQLPDEDLQIDRLLDDERKDLLDSILNQLGAQCQQLLHLYYYERLRMKTIVDLMNFSNDQVARNRKSACMKKLRSIVLASPIYKEMFRDQ